MMTHRLNTRYGFTLIEVMMALAISALLLTAVAAAFQASLMNYEANRDVVAALSQARRAMARMTTQLRTAQYVFSTTPAHQCDFFDDSNDYYMFEFRDADDKLVLIDDANNVYTLCDNVTALTFAKTGTVPDPNNAQSVRIAMTLDFGDRSQDLASAVAIRRNLTY